MNTMNELVKGAIKRYQKENKVSNAALAEIMNVSEELIVYFLNENSLTASATLDTLCDRLNLEPVLFLASKEGS